MNSFTKAQQAAIETMGCNLLVKAGAGAGKTRVLVERFLGLATGGHAEIDQIAAITFTRKAAREMKERIREQIRRTMNPAEGNSPFDRAMISTIHSLCSRILKEFPAEAAVAPEFVLLDEPEDQALRDEVWQQVLEQAARQRMPWLVNLLAVYSQNQLQDSFRRLFDQVEELGLAEAQLQSVLWPVPAELPEMAVSRFEQACVALFQAVPVSTKPNQTQARIADLRQAWPEIRSRLDRMEAEPEVLLEMEGWFKGLRASEKIGQDLRQARKELQNLQGILADRKVQQLIPDLCCWFSAVVSEVEERKTRQGLLNYNDLERKTEALLLSHPEICRRLRRRIRYVMVDECQDINERQRRIIYLLSGGDAETLRENNLFIVGDHKQSIYRFRGSDPAVFARVQRDVENGGGKVIELADNFRSRRELVGAFNDFFQRLMPAEVSEEAEGCDAVEYADLTGHHEAGEAARIEMWLLDGAVIGKKAAKSQEAEMLAGRILEMVHSSAGKIKFGDIAILFRAFSHVHLYETALAQAGIPYCIAGGRGLSRQQEIQDALNLLRYLDNPRNEMALFGLLRSPFLQLSDATLLLLKRSGEGNSLKAGLERAAAVADIDPHEQEKIRQAKIWLARWEGRCGFLTPEQILQEAFDDSGFDLIQLGLPKSERAFANLRKLMDIARDFTASGGRCLSEFLQYFEIRAAAEGEADIESTTGDTVQIMTIHKAKGLEFPVVVVPDLQRRFNMHKDSAVYLPGEGIGLKLPGNQGQWLESARFRRIGKRVQGLEKAELKRLLYVAMTRAKNTIALSAVVEQTKTEKTMQKATGWLDWTRSMLGLNGPLQEWPDQQWIGASCVHIRRGNPLTMRENPLRIPVNSPLNTDGTLQGWSPSPLSLPLPSGRPKPKTVSPAYLAEFVHCPRRYFYAHLYRLPQISTEEQGAEPTWTERSRAGLSGRQLGIAFHRFVEQLQKPSGYRETVGQVLEELLPAELHETARPILLAWAGQYLQSELLRQKATAESSRNEWPFQYLLLPEERPQLPEEHFLPPVWLVGQMDQVLLYPDGTLGIVDFKTDRVESLQIQEKAAKYRLQILGYAMAAMAAFNRPIRDARLYFVRLGEMASMDVGPQSLDRAKAEISSMADFIRRNEAETSYTCRTDHCPDCPFDTVCLKE